jgi:predicted acylesterase/phospholipase RssA
MNALILSGGGSFGSYEAGVIYEILKSGRKFDSIFGTSAGGLNSLLVAQSIINGNPEIIKKVWTEMVVQSNQIYKKSYWKILFGAKPMYNFSPLRKLLKEEVDFKKILQLKETITLTATDLITGESVSYSNKDLNMTPEKLLTAAVASASMPPVFDPVILDEYKLVDGGLRANVPVNKLFDNWGEADSALVVLCDMLDLKIANGNYDDMAEIGQRTIMIMMNEITTNNLKRMIQINETLKQIKKENQNNWLNDKKVIDLDIIMPSERLDGSVLEFNNIPMTNCFAVGRKDAIEYLKSHKN